MSRSDTATVFSRHRSCSAIDEVRVVGEINAPIELAKNILADLPSYPEFMPHTKQLRKVSEDQRSITMCSWRRRYLNLVTL